MSRTEDASIDARMSAAETTTLRARIGPCGCDAGECTRELGRAGVGGDLARAGRGGLLSRGAGEGPRLRDGSDGGLGVGDLTTSVPVCAAAKTEALPLPLSALEARPTVRWIKLSTAAAALPLSFAAPPLTAWIRVRFFRVVGDCRSRRVLEGRGWSPRP